MDETTPPNDDRLLTIAEACDRLRICPTTLRAVVRAGELTAVRIGRRVLFERSALDRFIATQRTPNRRTLIASYQRPERTKIRRAAIAKSE